MNKNNLKFIMSFEKKINFKILNNINLLLN